MIFRKLAKFNSKYNKIFTPRLEKNLEKITVFLAILLFIVHLLLIFSSRYFDYQFLDEFRTTSFIFAVSTPFTVFLFFELFQMILTIPRSIPEAVGKQFEVITIVLIRNIFKELSLIDDISNISSQADVLTRVAIDLFFAIMSFSLVLVFIKILCKVLNKVNVNYVNFKYVSIKKVFSLVMIFVSIALLIWSIYNGANVFGKDAFDNFFQNIFTIFIFIDVTLLLMSLIIVDNYPTIFSNAALIISTIIVRLTFTAEFPINNYSALGGIILGVATIYIFLKNVENDYDHNLL